SLGIRLGRGVAPAELRAGLGPPVRWGRAVPGPVCRGGRGLTAITFEPAVSPGVLRDVKQLFERVGQVIEIPERKFDAFTVTYSSSHGYHALAALAGAAQRAGLDRQTAMTAAAHALADGILVWRESKMARGEWLREAVTA